MTAARIALGVAAALVQCSCARYADFTLPRPAGTAQRIAVRWEASPAPLIEPGPAGTWDSVDVLNPSVIRHQGQYLNLYSGYDGHVWSTGAAVSSDGIAWTKRGRILTPGPAAWEGSEMATNGSAFEAGGQIYYWYQAGDPPRIGLARSTDGASWTKLPDPVLPLGPRGSWDERGVADPYVIRVGDSFYLYYLGQDRARRQRLGVARSADGIVWEKLRANPVLELGAAGSFDEVGLGEPAVWTSHGRYWMLYTGRDRKEMRRIGLASSSDGVRFERVPDAPVFAGAESWNSKVVCDPTVEPGGSSVRVWFGGGDVPHPVQNIHGRIGVANLFLEER